MQISKTSSFMAMVLAAGIAGCDDDNDADSAPQGGAGASAGTRAAAGTGGRTAGGTGGRAGAGGASAGVGGRADADVDAGAAGDLNFASFDDAIEKGIAAWNATDAGKMQPIRGASSVVVTKEGGLVHSHGYGEFAADRPYLIASSSKILSVGVLMKLADEGKLDIDKPISDYLGASWGEHKTKVSIAQLVSNSSGLPSLSELISAGADPTGPAAVPYAAHFCQYAPAGKLSDCAKGIYQDDTEANNREPDKVFRYGGSQWQLAGAIAEQVSGKAWADLIREEYVEACGASSLAYTNPFGPRDDGSSSLSYPPTFQGDAANAPQTENPSIEGGAHITAPDYAKLLLLHLRDGKCGDTQVLSAKAVERMRTDRVAAYGGDVNEGGGLSGSSFTGYGLGWWVAPELIADPGAYGAYPFLDLERGYGAMLMLETTVEAGGVIATGAKPALDKIFDAN